MEWDYLVKATKDMQIHNITMVELMNDTKKFKATNRGTVKIINIIIDPCCLPPVQMTILLI